MPWTPGQFKSKHNKGLTLTQAAKAARIAEGAMKSGVPEGEAIAIANKNAKRKGKRKAK